MKDGGEYHVKSAAQATPFTWPFYYNDAKCSADAVRL